jgi:hypothetical protein
MDVLRGLELGLNEAARVDRLAPGCPFAFKIRENRGAAGKE